MSKYARDPEAIARDIVIHFWHPRFAGNTLTETLRELKAARRVSRR